MRPFAGLITLLLTLALPLVPVAGAAAAHCQGQQQTSHTPGHTHHEQPAPDCSHCTAALCGTAAGCALGGSGAISSGFETSGIAMHRSVAAPDATHLLSRTAVPPLPPPRFA